MSDQSRNVSGWTPVLVCASSTRQVFGVPLVELMRRTPGQEVPWVLKRFVGYLSKFGLDVSAPRVSHLFVCSSGGSFFHECLDKQYIGGQRTWRGLYAFMSASVLLCSEIHIFRAEERRQHDESF